MLHTFDVNLQNIKHQMQKTEIKFLCYFKTEKPGAFTPGFQSIK